MIHVKFNFGDGEMPPQKKMKITIRQLESPVPSTEDNAEKKPTAEEDSSDWRVEHWRERLSYAQSGSLLCDVTFDVEGREFKAHKLVLAIASPVFEAMFYGSMAEKGDKVVITDLAEEGFKALLNYIYTNEVNLSTMEHAVQLWVAADKYCVPHVKTELCAFFDSCFIPPDYVWSTFQTALFLDIGQLIKKCCRYFEENPEAVMDLDDFTSISIGALKSFLMLESLQCSELTLMRGVIRWAKARMYEKPEMTLKQAVEPCLRFIRFGSMTMGDFCRFLDEAPKALSDADALAIMKHLANETSYDLPEWCCKTPWDRTVTVEHLATSWSKNNVKDTPSPKEKRKIPLQFSDSDSETSAVSDSSYMSSSSTSNSSSDSEDSERPRRSHTARRRGSTES